MLKELKVKRAINGDEKAFIELIEKQREKLYRVAYAYVKSEEDALDIVQETVYKAYISVDTLRKPKYFNTWLTKILINISLATLKKNKNIIYLDEEILTNKPADSEDRESKMDILSELDKLDKRYKDVIILKYFDDLTVREISEVLEIPIGTAKTYLNRGLNSLRKTISKENF